MKWCQRKCHFYLLANTSYYRFIYTSICTWWYILLPTIFIDASKFFIVFFLSRNSCSEFSYQLQQQVWITVCSLNLPKIRTILFFLSPLFSAQYHKIVQLFKCTAEFRRSVNQSKETLWQPTVNCRLLHFHLVSVVGASQKFEILLVKWFKNTVRRSSLSLSVFLSNFSCYRQRNFSLKTLLRLDKHNSSDKSMNEIKKSVYLIKTESMYSVHSLLTKL